MDFYRCCAFLAVVVGKDNCNLRVFFLLAPLSHPRPCFSAPGLLDAATMLFKLLVLGLCAAVAAASNAASEAYLAANAKKPGVVVLPSGLQYKVLESGPSPGKSPTASSPTECHYAGTLIDGTEFDSSYKRSALGGGMGGFFWVVWVCVWLSCWLVLLTGDFASCARACRLPPSPPFVCWFVRLFVGRSPGHLRAQPGG